MHYSAYNVAPTLLIYNSNQGANMYQVTESEKPDELITELAPNIWLQAFLIYNRKTTLVEVSCYYITDVNSKELVLTELPFDTFTSVAELAEETLSHHIKKYYDKMEELYMRYERETDFLGER